MRLFVIVVMIIMTGCATTQPKIVKVPVPVSCPKPVMPTLPYDYMADLTAQSSPPNFVKACLATREAYKIGYDNCIKTLEVYK